MSIDLDMDLGGSQAEIVLIKVRTDFISMDIPETREDEAFPFDSSMT